MYTPNSMYKKPLHRLIFKKSIVISLQPPGYHTVEKQVLIVIFLSRLKGLYLLHIIHQQTILPFFDIDNRYFLDFLCKNVIHMQIQTYSLETNCRSESLLVLKFWSLNIRGFFLLLSFQPFLP